MKKYIFLLLAVLIFTACAKSSPEVDAFAQCLTEKGVAMYGAFWCPHCQKQKKMFGDSFQYIKYVECDPRDKAGQPELCLKKGIKSYPTWIFSDGSREMGTQQFEKFAEKTGCILPTTGSNN